jgi:hypothetical protein
MVVFITKGAGLGKNNVQTKEEGTEQPRKLATHCINSIKCQGKEFKCNNKGMFSKERHELNQEASGKDS